MLRILGRIWQTNLLAFARSKHIAWTVNLNLPYLLQCFAQCHESFLKWLSFPVLEEFDTEHRRLLKTIPRMPNKSQKNKLWCLKTHADFHFIHATQMRHRTFGHGFGKASPQQKSGEGLSFQGLSPRPCKVGVIQSHACCSQLGIFYLGDSRTWTWI